MSKINIRILTLLTPILLIASCTNLQKDSPIHSEGVNTFEDKMNAPLVWQNNMQKMEKTIVELYPYLLSPKEFESKKNDSKITGMLSTLESSARNVNHSPMTNMNDPTLAFISFDFHEQVNDTLQAFKENKKDYARFELLKTTQFCIECHTKTKKGPSFSFSQFSKSVQNLDSLEQAEIFTATRRFDEALKNYRDFFKKEEASWDTQFKAQNALHNALSILIRYKRDPKATLEFLKEVEKSSFLQVYLRNIVLVWKEDIKIWEKETKNTNVSLTHAKLWIERANSRTFEYGTNGAEIWTQLSISYLHDFLTDARFEKTKSDILWMLGSSYINSSTFFQADLGEKYLESCITTFPHSFQSQRCYYKLESHIYENYSGSAGTFLPVEILMKLKKLNELAVQ